MQHSKTLRISNLQRSTGTICIILVTAVDLLEVLQLQYSADAAVPRYSCTLRAVVSTEFSTGSQVPRYTDDLTGGEPMYSARAARARGFRKIS